MKHCYTCEYFCRNMRPRNKSVVRAVSDNEMMQSVLKTGHVIEYEGACCNSHSKHYTEGIKNSRTTTCAFHVSRSTHRESVSSNPIDLCNSNYECDGQLSIEDILKKEDKTNE